MLNPPGDGPQARFLAFREGLGMTILPLTGGALVQRGLAKGPDVARTLKRLEARWIAAGLPSGVPDEWIDQAVGEAISR